MSARHAESRRRRECLRFLHFVYFMRDSRAKTAIAWWRARLFTSPQRGTSMFVEGSTESASIDVRGVRLRRGDRQALAGVDFEVAAGEVVGLLGPNGAGKSSLMLVLAGLMRPDEGTVLLGGEASPTDPRTRRHLGFAPQATAVYDELTVDENLHFFGRLYGLSGTSLRTAVDNARRFARLDDRGSARASTLSGGMRRRLHVAAAVVHQPKVLLLDEPTVGVDAESRRHLLDGVRELRELGCAIVYASHHLDEVLRVCDRVVVLAEGRVVASETPRALAARDAEGDLDRALASFPSSTDLTP
jgi:ABC-2 type transport system ATP-binding protein